MIVSSKWPDSDRSGVSLTAAKHVEIFARNGFAVQIIGTLQSPPGILECEVTYHVSAIGSGAIYSPARVDRNRLREIIATAAPDFILVEAWQTGISEAAIDTAFGMGIPVALISHGVSVRKFSNSWTDRVRALGWMAYAAYKLPRAIRKLDAVTALDLNSQCNRFLDRDLARRIGIPVFELTNCAAHLANRYFEFEERDETIVSVGYYSRIKNQLSLIGLMPQLPTSLSLRLIGRRNGRYYERCVELVRRLGIERRVTFLEDTECDVADEIARAKVYVANSLTEVLPVTILEAMAAGTPFVSSNVGAVSALAGGGVISEGGDFARAIQELVQQGERWTEYSNQGRALYQERYSESSVEIQAIELANYLMKDRFFA